MRLAEIASDCGKPAYLIDNAGEICHTWFQGDETVLITAGAKPRKRWCPRASNTCKPALVRRSRVAQFERSTSTFPYARASSGFAAQRVSVSLWGRFSRSAYLGERPDQVQYRSELREPHSIAIQELLQTEIAVQGAGAVLPQVFDQFRQQ